MENAGKLAVLRGEPPRGFEIIDAHNHLGRWQAFFIPGEGTAEQMVHRADQVGIRRMCVTAHAAIGPDYVYGNNQVAEALRQYPDRFIGYVTVNPNYPDGMRQELDRCFAQEGFRGIKLHPDLHGRGVDYEGYLAAFAYAEEHGLPILIHTWGYSNVADIDHLADRYPHANFIIAHTGGVPQTMEIALQILNRHENVYGDLAISTALEGNVEYFIKAAGSKKILFGTDMPFYDPSFTLARLAAAEITDEEKQDIFAGNIKRLMKLS